MLVKSHLVAIFITSPHTERKNKQLTKDEVGKYRQTLEAKQVELAAALRRRDAIVVELMADAIDVAQTATARAVTIGNLDRETEQLHTIRAALRRIDNGNFGNCVHCREEIDPKRLTAIPWAPFCIRCQGAIDRGESLPEERKRLGRLRRLFFVTN